MRMARNLTDRQRRILLLVVSHFIKTGEPVASRTLVRAYRLPVGTATIRNEMADLEALGYLEQPHTSAGRVPTDRGYRAYVDTMSTTSLSGPELESLKGLESKYLATCVDLNEVLGGTVRILAEVTQLVGVATYPRWGDARLERLQLVALGSGRILVVLVTQAGVVETHVLAIDRDIPQDVLEGISRIFNENFSKASVRALFEGYMEVLREIRDEYRSAVRGILERFFGTLAGAPTTSVLVEGERTMMEHPEYGSLERVREILRAIGVREEVVRIVRGLLDEPQAGDEAIVRIGSETGTRTLRDLSVVLSSLEIPGEEAQRATIGIIGPRRMAYPKVIACVGYINKLLNRRLKTAFGA